MSIFNHNMPKERVLITGGGGFLGSHIAHYFGALGLKIAVLGRFASFPGQVSFYPNLWKLCGMTLPDPAFESVVKEFQPTMIIHCAGTASVTDSVSDPYGDFRHTVEVCAFCLETVRCLVPTCRFFLLSSASVYGNPISLPITETARVLPVSPYGYHKMLCELLAEEYEMLHGLKIVILRIFSAYGERLNRQVIYDICAKFSAPGINPVVLHGNGDESRDFVHAQDVARAIEYIQAANTTGTFNVASGTQTTIKEIVNILSGCFNSSRQIEFSGHPRKGDPIHWQASIEKIASLGYTPSITLKDGISRYVKWFKTKFNGDNA